MSYLASIGDEHDITFIEFYDENIPVVAEILENKQEFDKRIKELNRSINRIIIKKCKNEKYNIVIHKKLADEENYCPLGERQKHGFDYEREVIERYSLMKSKNYTAEYDAYYNGIPVQIKCIKHGCAIEMGDYKRNSRKKDDFILIIGFWKGKEHKIIKEIVLYIDHEKFNEQLRFGDENLYHKIIAEMNLITNLKVDDEKWKQFCKKYKGLWPITSLFSIRFKRDHKKQKRIQCAIPWKNFVTFVSEFKEFKFSESIGKDEKM
jgi:hypothetical protein